MHLPYNFSLRQYRLLFTVGLTTATLRWLEWPKFTFRNFSLCGTWLLVWRVMVSLYPISVTAAYLVLPSQVVSIGDLQRLALYWFHAPGLQLDNEVSQSADQPHGTVCHQHYGHRTCRRAPSSGTARDVFMILAPDINIQTYLLTFSDKNVVPGL